MDTTYIMMKDIPVLEIDNYSCRILDYERLPVALRYEGVMFDDVMHGWTETRTMHIGRSNAKKILSGFGIRQSNPYTIARLFHFCSLSDCYWMKEKAEVLTWKDVSLFRNRFSDLVSATALLGVNNDFKQITERVHTPELTVQGMAAKAWTRENDDIYLYKVGKKELAASAILDTANIAHVPYHKVSDEDLFHIADEQRIRKIKDAGEQVVKCRIISSEEQALIPWEDFQMYCDHHEMNEYEYVKQKNASAYYAMQVADYILNNEDRHGANFGFFMDNATGEILKLYPLMDHDHAFSEEEKVPSQTSENNETLKEAAMAASRHVTVDLEAVLQMAQPEQLDEQQWQGVLERTKVLL